MTAEPDKSPRVPPRMEELFEYFERGKAFTEDLMRENERLRLRNLRLEHDLMEMGAGRKLAEEASLREENEDLRRKLASLEREFGEMEKENRDFANRYVEVQGQNDSLLSLYVSSYQLHSTLDPAEVIQVIEEIILNLIGAEEYMVCMVDPKRGEPMVVAGESSDGVQLGRPAPLDPVLAATLGEGKSFFRGLGNESCHLACTPLRVKKDVVGAISIRKLMSQKKDGFTAVDHELLSLLADHAATALVSSNLYERVARKLRTVEGFIELLKPGA